MGLRARATVTPKVIQQMAWSGSNLGSYEMASQTVEQLSGLEISAGRIKRQVEHVGEARIAERNEHVEGLKEMDLPQRREGSALPCVEVPEVAAVMMDGGRYQRRDNFRRSGDDSAMPALSEPDASTHWRESKVGCLLSMSSEVHLEDPCPDIPESFVHASVVQEIAKTTVNTGSNADSGFAGDECERPQTKPVEYEAPKLKGRDVVVNSASFVWHLEARARQLNFNAVKRQAFVADGAKTNWRIQQQHFPRATAIADLIHALAYAWSAAAIEDGKQTYQKWAQLIWQGDVSEVIEHLQSL